MEETKPNITIKEKPNGEKTIDVDAPNATMRLVLGTNGDTCISLFNKGYPSNCVRLQNYIHGKWRVTEEQEWPQNPAKVSIEKHQNGVFMGSINGSPVFYCLLKENAFSSLQLLNSEKKTYAAVNAGGEVVSHDPDIFVKKYGYSLVSGYGLLKSIKSPEA